MLGIFFMSLIWAIDIAGLCFNEPVDRLMRYSREQNDKKFGGVLMDLTRQPGIWVSA